MKFAFVTAAKLNTACTSCKKASGLFTGFQADDPITVCVARETLPFNLLMVFNFYYLEVWESMPFA